MGDESDPMQAFGKLAAAGADGKIVVFYLVCAQKQGQLTGQGKDNDSDKFQVSVTAEMAQAHGASDINCVAWAPAKDGTTPPTMLASTGDDGEVLIWV